MLVVVTSTHVGRWRSEQGKTNGSTTVSRKQFRGRRQWWHGLGREEGEANWWQSCTSQTSIGRWSELRRQKG
ncbi:hypothetical protein V6N13_025005 [Hibiscus sabdariffa]